MLRYYDFDTRVVRRHSSRTLLADEGINAAATETFLNRYIERPLALAQEAVTNATTREQLDAALNDGTYRAYAGLFWLQSDRLRDARATASGAPERRLDELATKGIEFLDGLVSLIHQRYELVFGVVNTGSRLFFPETGLFAMPAPLQPPILCMPLTTMVYIAFLNREEHTESEHDPMLYPNMPMCASVGLANVRRVILPPDIEPPTPEAFDTIRGTITSAFETWAELAFDLGFDAWLPD